MTSINQKCWVVTRTLSPSNFPISIIWHHLLVLLSPAMSSPASRAIQPGFQAVFTGCCSITRAATMIWSLIHCLLVYHQLQVLVDRTESLCTNLLNLWNYWRLRTPSGVRQPDTCGQISCLLINPIMLHAESGGHVTESAWVRTHRHRCIPLAKTLPLFYMFKILEV